MFFWCFLNIAACAIAVGIYADSFLLAGAVANGLMAIALIGAINTP